MKERLTAFLPGLLAAALVLPAPALAQAPAPAREAQGTTPESPASSAEQKSAAGPTDEAMDSAARQASLQREFQVVPDSLPPFESSGSRSGVVRIGSDYTLKVGDDIREAVVIFAGATIEGRVDRDVLVVLGKTRLASTAVINGSLIVIGGDATVESGAVVRRDLVVAAGSFDAPPDFAAGGDHVVVDPRGAVGPWFQELVTWLTHGLLWGRLVVPSLPLVWTALAVFFFLYLLLNLLFDRPVRLSAEALAEKPISAFVVGLLVLVLSGPVILLLGFSVVGLIVVPFVLCALLVACIIGRAAAVRWIGMGIVHEDQEATRAQSIRSFAIGFAVLCLAYMVPVVGLAAWTMVGLFGLGSATLAFIAAYRRENPAPIPAMAGVPVSTSAFQPLGGVTMSSSDSAAVQPGLSAPSHDAPVNVSDMTLFARASLRDRFGAGVLDVILVVLTWQFLQGFRDNAIVILFLGYLIGFWTWKGTTVGGIICQLRVVRADGAPLRFADALVRGLSCLFSAAVVGLGFLWILKDPERQAWHDKIAGTFVVKVPRNWPL